MGSGPGWEGELLCNNVFRLTHFNKAGPSLVLLVKQCCWTFCWTFLFHLFLWDSMRASNVLSLEVPVYPQTWLFRVVSSPLPILSWCLLTPGGLWPTLTVDMAFAWCLVRMADWFSQLIYSCVWNGGRVLGLMCVCGGVGILWKPPLFKIDNVLLKNILQVVKGLHRYLKH